MGWLLRFMNSSIGKKFVMAVTGSFLMIFLIVHLIGNPTLYFGPETFNGYVETLDVIKPLISTSLRRFRIVQQGKDRCESFSL